MTLAVAPANALVNVALSPARTLKSLKLWNRLPPTCVPSVSGIAKAGPVSAPARSERAVDDDLGCDARRVDYRGERGDRRSVPTRVRLGTRIRTASGTSTL